LEYKNATDFSVIKKSIPRGHIEKCKGDKKQNVLYCIKEGNILINEFELRTPLEIKKELYLEKMKAKIKDYREWQLDILNIVEGEEDDRSIYWFYETTGCVGKSTICKILYARNDISTVLGDGKKADVAFKIAEWQKNNEHKDPDVIILDCPRDNIGHIDYTIIEKLKDGLFSSGKFESCEVFFLKIPHILIFANEEPEYDKVSLDRWNVYEIIEDKLVKRTGELGALNPAESALVAPSQ